MAIKYAENTSYNPSTSTSDYLSIQKTLRDIAKQRLTTLRANQATKAAASTEPYHIADVSPYFGTSQEDMNKVTESARPFINSGVTLGSAYPAGTTIKKYEETTGKKYGTIVDPATKEYLKTANYLSPSEVTPSARFANLTRGGQYLIEDTAPGRGIQTERGPFNWKENELLRQGLDPNLYQIDHATPLWAGGTDTVANKEILDNITHTKKTNIQAVPYTLMAYGLISQREALAMATDWAARDAWDIAYPEPDPTTGLISKEDAQRIAEKWKKNPAITLKKFLQQMPVIGKNTLEYVGSGVTTAGDALYKAGSDFMDQIVPKNESPVNAGVREFTKGFVSGFAPGASLAMPQLDTYADYNDKTANTAGNVSHVLGSIAGNVFLFGAAYKLAVKGLAKIGVKWAAKEIAPQVALDAAEAAAARKASMEAAQRTLTNTGKKGTIKVLAKEENTINKATLGEISKEVSPVWKYVNNTLPKAATLGAVSAAIGQTRAIPEDQTRVERAMADFAYAFFSPVGTASYNLKGYSMVAAPALTIGLMEGLNPTDAFVNAMTMVGMHGTGQIGQIVASKGKSMNSFMSGNLTNPADNDLKNIKTFWSENATPKELMDQELVTTAPKVGFFGSTKLKEKIDAAVQVVAKKFSIKWRSVKAEELINDIDRGGLRPELFGFSSKESLRKSLMLKTTREIDINKQNTVLDKYLKWRGEQETWSKETLLRERGKVFVTGRELYKSGMTKVARTKADLEDFVSYTEKMKGTDPDHSIPEDGIKNIAYHERERFLNTAPTQSDLAYDPAGKEGSGAYIVAGTSMPGRFGVSNDVEIKNLLLDKNIAKTEMIDPATGLKNGRIAVSALVYHDAKTVFAGNKANPESSLIPYVPNSRYGLKPLGGIASKRYLSEVHNPSITKDNFRLKKYGLVNEEYNNETLLRAMRNLDTNVLPATMIINPEGLNNRKGGVFAEIIINDNHLDPIAIKRLKESYTKPSYTEEEIMKVVDTLKIKPDYSKVETPGGFKTPEQEMAEFEAFLNSDNFFKDPNNSPIALSIYTALKLKKEPIISKFDFPKVEGQIAENQNIGIKTEALNRQKKGLPTMVAEEPPATPADILAMASKTETEMPPVVKPKKEKDKSFNNYVKNERGSVEGTNDGMSKYTNNPDTLKNSTRSVLMSMAKEVSEGGKPEAIASGWPEFLAKVEAPLKIDNNNPDFSITNKDDLRGLQTEYKKLAQAQQRKEVSYDKINNLFSFEKGDFQNQGQEYVLRQNYNKKNGYPEDSMEVVGISQKVKKQEGYKAIENEEGGRMYLRTSVDKLQGLKKEITSLEKGEEYIPVGLASKGLESAMFVKVNKDVAKKFDIDPRITQEKYLNEGENPKDFSEQDKFLRVWMTDVLGLPKDMSSIDLVKRTNLIFQRHNQYVGKDMNEPFTFKIVTSKKMGDNPSLVPSADYFENSTDPEVKKAIESFLKLNEVDGKFFIGEEVFNKIIKDAGMDPNTTALKFLITTDVDGVKVVHKGHGIKADSATANWLRTKYQTELGKNEIVSFNSNAKLGPKGGELNLPLSSIFSQPLTEGVNKGIIGPDFKRKLKSSDIGTKEDMLADTITRMNDVKKFDEAIAATKSKQEFDDVVDQLCEKYNLDKDSLFYGVLGKSFELGAAKVNLHKNMKKIEKNIFMKTVIDNSLPNAARAFISPSFEMIPDGKGSFRNVSNDEIVLGAEAMKRRNLKEGDKVMVSRDPSMNIRDVLILKVIDGSKLKHTSLGSEHAIVSPLNERVKLKADQDGDTLLFVKIGEGGVPESYANAVIKRGAKAIPFTEVNESTKQFVTAKNVEEVMNNQLIGDDQTAIIAKATRISEELSDYKMTIKVHAAVDKVDPKNGKIKKVSKFEYFSNGKKVGESEGKPSKYTFVAKPKWGYEELKTRLQSLQEAVDSKKSNDIALRTENNPDWAIREFYATSGGKNINEYQASALSSALETMQLPHEIKNIAENSNSIDQILRKIKPNTEILQRIKDSGTELTPYHESLLNLSSFDEFVIPDPILVKQDALGIAAVEKANPKMSLDSVKKNKAVMEFTEMFKREKRRYSISKTIAKKSEGKITQPSKAEKTEIRKRIEDFFFTRLDEGKYTEEDVDAIAYWLATTKNGNMSWNYKNPLVIGRDPEHYYAPNYVQRFDSIIQQSEKVAKPYLEGSEVLDMADVAKVPSNEKNLTTAKNITSPTQQENIKNLLKSQAKAIEGATSEKPKVIVSAKTDGKYTLRGAVSLPDKNVIIIEEPTLLKKFKDKAWTKPTVEGVKPLPVDQFKGGLPEYRKFVINHEKAHFLPEVIKLTGAAKENSANKIALSKTFPNLVKLEAPIKKSDWLLEPVVKEELPRTKGSWLRGPESKSS